MTKFLQKHTTNLLVCGIAAGLLFLIVSYGQALLRPGFDLSRHALSALALGDLGWLQVANFAITGLLAIAFAFGLWQALHGGKAGTAGPILVGIYGVAMIGGGIFNPDPSLGWPQGAPAGIPDPSAESITHIVFGFMAFMSIIIAGFVFMRKFLHEKKLGWAIYSGVSGGFAFILTALPWSAESESVRFAIAAVIISGWISIIAWQTLTSLKPSAKR